MGTVPLSDYNTQPTPSTGTTSTTQPTHGAVVVDTSLPKTGSNIDGIIIYGTIIFIAGTFLCLKFILLPWLRGDRD